MECPRVDELPRAKGCQVSCRNSHGCSRGTEVCTRVKGCDEAVVNDEGTHITPRRKAVFIRSTHARAALCRIVLLFMCTANVAWVESQAPGRR
eukprot:6198302-Pleurochrysis_carterae.AAC.1